MNSYLTFSLGHAGFIMQTENGAVEFCKGLNLGSGVNALREQMRDTQPTQMERLDSEVGNFTIHGDEPNYTKKGGENK